jgi:hypothetical protein
VLYIFHIAFAVYSLFPTRDARLAHETKVAEKKAWKEKWASSPADNEMTAEQQWQHMWELQQLPRTPGTATGPGWTRAPMTPRTTAFSALEGQKQAHVQHSSPIQEQDEFVQGQGQHISPLQQQQAYYPSPEQHQQAYYPSPEQHQQAFYPSPVQGHPQGQPEWGYDGKGKGTAV